MEEIGWRDLAGALRSHYIGKDGHSLCGMWHYFDKTTKEPVRPRCRTCERASEAKEKVAE
jgi:hypothetical protein